MSFAETGTKRLGSGDAPSEDCLGAFVKHLRSDGLSDGQICHLRREARHFLLWLDRHRNPIGEVDHGVLGRFRRHDCRCPGMEGQRRRMLEADSRRFMTGALRLVRFLEDEGRIGHPGELEDNLDHLDAFLERCPAQDYGSVRLNTYRSSCRHILIWLHQSRIAIRNVAGGTLNRFLDHDCVCPGSFEAPRPRSSHSWYSPTSRRSQVAPTALRRTRNRYRPAARRRWNSGRSSPPAESCPHREWRGQSPRRIPLV